MRKKIGLAVALLLFLILVTEGFWLLNREGEPRLDVISRKDALEDYDYLWETLEENYPFFGVAERKYGLDIQQLKQDYRQQLEGMGKEIDFLEFYQLMGECMMEFYELGHLAIYSSEFYQQIIASREYVYKQSLGKWQFENLLENPKVQERYEFLESQQPSDWSEQTQSERLRFDRLQDDVAYLAISNFWGQYIQQDRELILNFFEENADVPYLILDIRGNGGGSSEYWSENFVSPNITEIMSVSLLKITPYGKASQEQMKLDGYQEKDWNAENQELEKLPNINQDDLTPSWYWKQEEEYAVAPQSNEKIYKGRIFLLVDEKTGSAASSFVYFCKGTGFATVIGQENSRGNGPGGNFVMDQLPHSHLLFNYRPVLALDMEGAALEEFGVAPDVLLPTRAKNSNDKISALAACLSYIEGLENNE